MGVFESVQVALEALVANKLRAGLTMLGIVIGVGAVIALMAVGQGSQKAVADRIAGLGTNLVFIRPGSASSSGVRTGQGTARTLTSSDADAIATNVSNVAATSPELNFALQVLSSGQNTFTRVNAVTPTYPGMMNLTMASGEFFTDDDMTRSARVAVLGSSVAQNLFPNGDATGQQIRVSQGPRTVITVQVAGVLMPKGGSSSQSSDDRMFMPLTTVQHQISSQFGARNSQVVSQVSVQVTDKSKIPQVKQDITDLLSQRHQVVTPDFTVESQEDLTAAVNQVSQTMTVLLGSIAGISLIVGGIGIMNIMLVSVTERTREIGIRKAVGARPSDIMMQFLTEALTVTALGGMLGVAGGVGTAQLLNGRDIAGLGNDIQTVVSWTSVVVAFAVTGAIGIFFGLYPAQRAARLNPIEALRYE